MRELKFRAWNTQDKEMVYWDGFHEVDDDYCYAGQYPINNLSEVPVMQYTGLLDKNGKEIYESDIVKTKFYKEPFLVEWDGDGVLVDGSMFPEEWCYGFKLPADYEEIEILGNLYESPELLEVK